MNLGQIIDTKRLQEIQDKFSNATGLSAITVDFRGVPVTSYSNFTSFCMEIRKTKTYEDRCHRCDAYGGIEASRKDSPYIYRCHAGLADFAIPIKVKGQFIGSVLAGQAKLNETDLKKIDHMITEITYWENNEKLTDAYNKLPVTSLEKVDAGAKLLESIISTLIEKDIIKYIQENLNEKNNKLMQQMQEQKNLERDLEEKERTALQPRINVNFLQNSLNTASRLSILENAEKTTDTLYDISDILQYTVQQTNQLVKMEEEIAHIRRYLNLQMLRFGDRFQYELDIDQKVLDREIPSLILQSIVDNALIHGLETKNGNGFLRILADVVDEDIIIKIMDNGVGIPTKILEQIQLDQFQKMNDSTSLTTGMDLFTIKLILKHHYGNDFKMTITSYIHKGTSVILMIPKESN
ncbi:sensor histidine kinase [Oceanobacillus halophilus]|nr:PocR ligand-binding domain-containing protein [Oceanobacillus halophilus]